jgi:hypothetical protein
VVPFPVGTKATLPASALNFTVESAVDGTDLWLVVSTNASSASIAQAANLTVVVHPSAYWDAASTMHIIAENRLFLDAGGNLGGITASFSQSPVVGGECPGRGSNPCLEFAVQSSTQPLVMLLSRDPLRQIDPALGLQLVAAARGQVRMDDADDADDDADSMMMMMMIP